MDRVLPQALRPSSQRKWRQSLLNWRFSGFQARTIEFNNCTINHVIDVIVQSAPVPDIV